MGKKEFDRGIFALFVKQNLSNIIETISERLMKTLQLKACMSAAMSHGAVILSHIKN